MVKTETIKIDGIDLEVSYHYDEGMQSDDYDVPNDDNEFHVNEVYVNGVNIIDLLTEEDLIKIDELCTSTW